MLEEYVLYKGDKPIFIGTVFDIARQYDLQLDYIEFITDNQRLIERSIENGTYDEQYIIVSTKEE